MEQPLGGALPVPLADRYHGLRERGDEGRDDRERPAQHPTGGLRSGARSTLKHPEPFASALASGRLAEVADEAAPDARSRLARGVVRARLGREADARADLAAAEPELGDVVAIERLLMDLTDLASPAQVLVELEALLERSHEPAVRARVLHVRGLALARNRQSPEAIDALQEALGLFRKLEDRSGAAATNDVLGQLFASLGQLEPASGYYALAIAERLICGDRHGAAISLGNLGRLHLRAGRFEPALECFRLDEQLAQELGDLRGLARMANDRGRALLALGRLDEAKTALEQALARCAGHPFEELEVFVWKDLARVHVARSRGPGDRALDHAAQAILRARAFLAARPDPFAHALVEHAEGERLCAGRDAAAVPALEAAVDALSALETPDAELAARLSLAKALRDAGQPQQAERCLLRALRRAQQDGFARYLAPIRESLLSLELTPGAEDEHGMLEVDGQGLPTDGAYVRIRELGGGSFGTVYRAFDVHRNRMVAVKRLRLDDLYDPVHRQVLAASIRVELHATSRIRHPGIAHVLAIGTDRDGGMYVVQELVEGRTLAARIRETAPAPYVEVLATGSRIADALHVLHEVGVVHRDLKPANVVLRQDSGLPVLIDMGVAHVPDLEAAVGQGFVVGTWQYMAPEQAQGERVGGAADVYALGVLLFEWLTGFSPRPIDVSSADAIRRAFKQPAELLTAYRGDAPADLEPLLARMLERSSKRRPTASDVARRLEALAESAPRKGGTT